MLRKTCFGRWIGESIPYRLASCKNISKGDHEKKTYLLRDELKIFVHDIEELILPPAKNQGQQVEQGVQLLTSHCTGNGRNESTTSAFL